MGYIPECPEEIPDPLRMVSFGPAPPAIATVAPELIDEILDHLIVALQISPTHNPRPKSLLPYALVSQNWREAVQRRTMSSLVVRTRVHAERVISNYGASGLSSYVKHLKIGCYWFRWQTGELTSDRFDPELNPNEIETANDVARTEVLALLPLFPNVTSFHFTPPLTSFGADQLVLLQSCALFDQLTSLTVETRCKHSNAVELIRNLLVLAPNLVHLSLISHEKIHPLFPNKYPPVVLPHLQSLDLSGGAFASEFLRLNLLSHATLQQIVQLKCKANRIHNNSIRHLFNLVAPSLRTLDFTASQHDDLTANDFLSALQEFEGLQRMRLHPSERIPGLLNFLPPTLHTITFPFVQCAGWLLEDLTLPPVGLKTIRIDGDYSQSWLLAELKPLVAVVEACKRGNIKLVGARCLTLLPLRTPGR
ncbi:hypothetical protein RQP46_006189 [Phenoliferia psychrophenolica]